VKVDATSRLFHLICVKEGPRPRADDQGDVNRDELSASRFFDRIGPSLDLQGKAVLDIGCGAGAACFEAAKRGARRVVGVDLQLIDVARTRLERRHGDLAGSVEFVETDGTLTELRHELFDVVLSKDSFEHYADPESFIRVMTGFLAPRGELVVSCSAFWMGPYGGHIDYMTKVPWAHLVFPERVIMAERRRFRPGEDALRFGDVVGGLNKMTFSRFQAIMSSSGLECVSFRTNVSDHPAVRIMKLLAGIPPLREFFTSNAYTIWRKPAGVASRPDVAGVAVGT